MGGTFKRIGIVFVLILVVLVFRNRFHQAVPEVTSESSERVRPSKEGLGPRKSAHPPKARFLEFEEASESGPEGAPSSSRSVSSSPSGGSSLSRSVLEQMSRCFGLGPAEGGGDQQVPFFSFISHLEHELGPVEKNELLWSGWITKDSEGKSWAIHVKDYQGPHRGDQQGPFIYSQPAEHLPLSSSKGFVLMEERGSEDAVIKKYLAAGESPHQAEGMTYTFGRGEMMKMEVVDGAPSYLLMMFNDISFQCTNLRTGEGCECEK